MLKILAIYFSVVIHSACTVSGVHVALVSSCTSHLSRLLPISNTLASNPDHRVTFVTSRECRETVQKSRGTLFDTGLWRYRNHLDENNATFGEMYSFYRELSWGENVYSWTALERLIQTDMPDLVIADYFMTSTSAVADRHEIPFAYSFIAVPHPAFTDLRGHLLAQGVMQMAASAVRFALFKRMHLIAPYFVTTVNELREWQGKPALPDFMTVLSSHPVIVPLGAPLFPLNVPRENFHVLGLLRVEKEDLGKLDHTLVEFIERSDKPILYIALGSHANFSPRQFGTIQETLAEQTMFNVIWAHKASAGDEVARPNMIIRSKFDQKAVLSSNKVKVFMSHCGFNSVAEGIARGTVFIATPQGRDQLFNAAAIVTRGIGVRIPATPSREQLLTALSTVHQNYPSYKSNLDRVRQELSANTTENILQIVESLAARKTSTFIPDASYDKLYELEAILLIGVSVGMVSLSVILKTIYNTVKKPIKKLYHRKQKIT